tara:strand:+ start:349 stop:966 length:618 start_codon:yes stop_codon:yes gene_type:complete
MGYLKVGKYYGPNPEGLEFEYKEILDEYYQDVSSVDVWFNTCEYAGKDYLFARTGSMGYIENVASGSFDNLTPNDQKSAAQNFCVDKTDRDKLYTDAEQEEYWSIYIAKAQVARQTRWNKVKSYISYRLTKDQSNEVADDTIVLNEKYIYYGIESKAIDNVDGLFDYVEGTAAYSSSGFPSKPYYTTELRDGVMNFLNGTYNITP